LPVDSFKFLPRLIATFYQMIEKEPKYPVPWNPLPKELGGCRFGLITSGGLYQMGVEPPFDIEREKREPTWGDPSYRSIPTDIRQDQVLVLEGRIGGLATFAYSFMGYQGFPPDTLAWEETQGPQVAEKFIAEGVDCVFLTPA
jgi:hypothetical protein